MKGNRARGVMVLAVLVTAIATTGGAAIAHADVAGVASVVDGDTVEIHGQKIGLHGIDAPESGQVCLDATGRKWRCGQRAALALQDLIGRRTVSCDERDVDRYGRTISQCFVGETNINEWLVAQGLALAYRRYPRDYVPAENEAREAGRGCGRGSWSRRGSGGADGERQRRVIADRNWPASPAGR